MSYSKRNLRDVEDSAAKFGYSEIQEARFAGGDLEAEATGLAYHVLRPGKRQGFAHVHENAEEIYVVLSGSGRIKLDDEILEIGPMDAIRVAPKVTRMFEAGPDALELLAFGPHHDKDGEIVQGFWED
ncbi:MAG: cupin domain-containing protein [Solirubrobacteraceae bacterium]